MSDMRLPKTVIPKSLDNYLRAEGYDAGALPTDISATRLKDSPRVTRLFKEHSSQIQTDYLKRGYAKLGEAWHSYMEKHAPDGWITERRFYAQVDGKIVSGAIDALEPTETGFKIWDYKLMTAYKAQTDLKEFERQLNIYAFLLRQTGLNVDGLYISAIIRDWSDRKVGTGNYPDTMFPVFELPLWPAADAAEYVRSRIDAHYSKDLPLCTDEERWMSDPKWAVVLEKTGRTVKLYDHEDEALRHKTKSPFFVQKREAEPIRCQRWCEVAEFCDQYQAELYVKEITGDGQD